MGLIKDFQVQAVSLPDAGTEPADVYRSIDGGASWQGSFGFKDLPSRPTWSFPAPPHEPHVLSVETITPQSPGETRYLFELAEMTFLTVRSWEQPGKFSHTGP